MTDHRIRWGDLISPRALYTFTLQDAFAAIPTLLTMGAFFIIALILIIILKKILNWVVDRRTAKSKYVLVRKGKDGKRHWKEDIHSSLQSMAHVAIETLVFGLIVVAAFFSASIGNVNIWESPIALSVIGMVITYIFGSGLQQIGSGYFVYAFNGMVVGEWWEVAGSHEQGGIVHRVTIWYVEFVRMDAESQCACFLRIPMQSILNGSFERNLYKEMNASEVTIDSINKFSTTDVIVKQHKAAAAAAANKRHNV